MLIFFVIIKVGDNMKALVTGASSGIGLEIAKYLDSLGYDLVLVSRDILKIKDIEFKQEVKYLSFDLSKEGDVYKLYESLKKDDIDIVVNNAGFGVYGEFFNTRLDLELSMIDLNIKALHILTKLFLKDFKNKDKGYILNIASSAGFLPGPLMASYYASKSYVINLTLAIYEEVRKENSNVYVGVVCPGPVATNFNKVAGVNFSIKPLTSEYVAKYSVDLMFKKKLLIIPGFNMKISYLLNRFVPKKILLKIIYKVQKRKTSH
jgi:uncharacterized protein